MNFPHGKAVTLITTTTSDDGLGNKTLVNTEVEIPGCAVAPRFSVESADPHSSPVMIGLTAYMPAGTVIDSDDLLRIDGKLWQVDGLPAEWTNPFTGWTPGIEVPVKRASGV